MADLEHDPDLDLPPWERQPAEPNLWFARFEAFRLAGPTRSVFGTLHAEEVAHGKAKFSGGTPGAWTIASRRWRWRERALAWDASERDRVRGERARALEAAYDRYAESGRLAHDRGLEALRALDPTRLSPADMLSFLERGARLEQDALAAVPLTDLERQVKDLLKAFGRVREGGT